MVALVHLHATAPLSASAAAVLCPRFVKDLSARNGELTVQLSQAQSEVQESASQLASLQRALRSREEAGQKMLEMLRDQLGHTAVRHLEEDSIELSRLRDEVQAAHVRQLETNRIACEFKTRCQLLKQVFCF